MSLLKRHAPLFTTIHRILDIVVLIGITWVASRKYGQPDLMRLLPIYGSLFLVVIFSLFGVYKSWRVDFISSQIKTLFFAWCTVLAAFNVLILLLSNKEQLAILWPYCLFKSPQFIYWSLFVFLGLVALRIVIRLGLVFVRESGYNQRQAVIAGVGEAGIKLAQYLQENRWMGVKLLGFFDDNLQEGDVVKVSPKGFGPVLGSIEKCPEFCRSRGINFVFIALPMRNEQKIAKLIFRMGTKGVAVFLVPDLFTLGIQRAKVHPLGELHLLDFNVFPVWKRAFDIFFSLTAIIITLPLWLIIVILIKIEDGGPIFYKHPRVMESGKKFSCIKFRTMHLNADQRLEALLEQNPLLREEWTQTYKLKNDPRITRLGKFLRRTSLDELPQFLNILAGQMSVVGARPVVSEELEKYYENSALTYCAMKPGLTGPWQIGERSDTGEYSERVALDNWYMLNNSIWLDTKIIFLTIWRIIRPKGAY
jgi:exopolysaccharide biosynthesis polyprenyl glycosylphosphotransferase